MNANCNCEECQIAREIAADQIKIEKIRENIDILIVQEMILSECILAKSDKLIEMINKRNRNYLSIPVPLHELHLTNPRPPQL